MNNYKRLTERRGDLVIDNCRNCPNLHNPQGCIDATCYGIMKNRLAELEDKIEAGTLVTVPYAIGQEVYWVDKKGYFDVEKVKVSLITIRHDGSVDIRLNHYNDDGSYRSCFKYDPKYYELFDNEVDAKKRLEEIRNETKSIDTSDK